MKRQVRHRFAAFALLVLASIAGFASAQETVPGDTIPASLREWTDWILRDADWRACPMLSGTDGADESSRVCVWPGALTIDANESGATFELRYSVYARSAVALPGTTGAWPQDVRANGAPVPVVPDALALPVIWLDPGEYTIAGRYDWVDRPSSLAVPEAIAIVKLTLDGKAIFPLQRESGALWLGRAESSERQADSLTIEVFRKLTDGVPATLETRVVLNVSGEGREEIFAAPLPAGFEPMSLSGGLPARLDPDGKLRVQVRPGAHVLTLVARAVAPLAAVERPASKEPWPADEVWSYEATPRLRVSTATSARVIDPSQAGVPGEWASLPAFVLAAGEKLAIEERSRGLSPQDQNRLSLTRQMWLAFDGSGFDLKDNLRGEMVRDWRLDMAAPYALQRATENGEGLLVTKGGDALTGVEVRSRQVAVDAGARLAQSGGELPIAGWQQSFDSVSTTLHLPPGYRLYAAIGADSAPNTWLDRWNLLDVFIVAVTVLLARWFAGYAVATIVLLYLLLAYHEPNAPLLSVLAVIVLALVSRMVTAAGRLSTVLRWARNVALVALVVLALPFVAAQAQLALHPQLEQYGAMGQPDFYGTVAGNGAYDQVAQEEAGTLDVPEAVMAPPPPPVASAPMEKRRSSDIVVTGSRIAQPGREAVQRMKQRYAENTVVQAGAGEPSWRWNSYGLSWSGPVLAEQSVRLVISPPWFTRIVRLLVVLLLALLVARIAKNAFGALPNWRRFAAAIVLATASFGASAQPSPELLQEFQAELLRAPDCAPTCAAIADADIDARGDTLTVGLSVSAAERVAVPLPGQESVLGIRTLTIDGSANSEVFRRDNGEAWVVLDRGVHRVEVVFDVADADRIPLRFPLRPEQARFVGDGYEVQGLRDERLLTDTLDISRVREDGATSDATVAQQFPPYVRVVRRITFGIDWEIETEVQRLAPDQAPFSVRIPLLPGERVLSSELKVEDGQVEVPMQAGASSAYWRSRLDRSPTIAIKAPDLARHAEVWFVESSPMWNVRFSGVPAVYPDGSEWYHAFHPLPGETLALSVARPVPVEGASIAIDGVNLSTSVGKRAAEHTLTLSIRSTQGGQHVVGLPADAEVLEVTADGVALNVRPEGGKLALPIHPGVQSAVVRWRESREVSFASRTPAVSLAADASNLQMDIGLPADRWVIATSGPLVGPAVLYWPELLVMILVAFALSRLKRTPLKLHDWLLLGLGFSAFSWVALLIVVAWLFALDWRCRRGEALDDVRFNLSQLGLVALSGIALIAIVSAIPNGLLGTPDMHLTGNGSTPTSLRWFHDRTADAMPIATAYSLPLWAYKAAMLAWALWLSAALVRWLRWGWQCYSASGYWRARAKPVVATPDAVSPAPSDVAPEAGMSDAPSHEPGTEPNAP